MKLDRRTFLKAAGLSGLSLAFPEIFRASSTALAASAGDLFDEERYFYCGVCDNACGMIARYKDGRIREIVANPADELGAQGSICVKGESAMNTLYDPDRLKYPMKRTNPEKGIDVDPGWVRISWDEAFETIGKKFKEAIDKYGPRTLLYLGRPKEKEKALVQAVGTPNQVCHVDTCYLTHDLCWKVSWGAGKSWCMDLDKAKYIISFGWDQPAKSKMYQLKGFLNALENGAKVVVFDPRYSVTASKAHEWFPIKPGTDLAVALAMIYVLIDEELYDKEYVQQMTSGFDLLAEHVKKEGYTPQWAEKISEVPAADIARIAREFGKTRPAMVALHKRDAGGPCYANSFSLAQAELILNALVGAIERPGGHYMSRMPAFPEQGEFLMNPEAKYPEIAEKVRVDGHDKYPLAVKMAKGFAKGDFSHLADGMLNNPPYPVKVGIAKGYGILSFPNQDTIIEALKTLDFLVVIDILPNEMCMLADIVLPDEHFLESKGFEAREYHALWPQVLFRDGSALYDNRGFGPITNGILKAMGLGDYAVWWDEQKMKMLEIMGYKVECPEYEALLGDPDPATGERKRVKKPDQAAQDALKAAVEETRKKIIKENQGIWQDKSKLGSDGRPKPKTEFNTASKKIELFSSALDGKGYEALPTWHPKEAEPDGEYQFYFLTNHLPWNRMNRNSNDPALRELQPENFLHMHPDTAKKIGVKDNDYVLVEAKGVGKPLKIRVRTTKGIRPDCVMTEHGFGQWSKGYSVANKGKGTYDGDLTPNRKIEESLKMFKKYDPAQSARQLDVCVKVTKA
jgi:thiosulfate reductase/polysulfide reductase chain A